MSATLRLFVTDASATSGTLYRTGTTWNESTINYNNRPGTTGGALGGSRNAALGQWVEFDVTSTVTGAGDYGFTLTNGTSDLVGFSSRQGAHPPQLVISYGGGGAASLPMPASPGLALSRYYTTVAVQGDQPGDPLLRPRGLDVRAQGRRALGLGRQRRPRVRGGRHHQHRAAGNRPDRVHQRASRRRRREPRLGCPAPTTSSRPSTTRCTTCCTSSRATAARAPRTPPNRRTTRPSTASPVTRAAGSRSSRTARCPRAPTPPARPGVRASGCSSPTAASSRATTTTRTRWGRR